MSEKQALGRPDHLDARVAAGFSEEAKRAINVETVHHDQALRVLAEGYENGEWSEAEENQLVRKIDRKLLVILVLTYGLQYYDKGMLSQAAIFGIRKDLALIGDRYSFSSSIFYLGFVCGAIPAVLLAQHFPVERVAAIIVAVWGVCVATTAACDSYKGLYTQRFFLGALEAGISPMFMMIVASFYKKDEQALRMGIWWCATGYVSVFAPLINYGLGHITGALASWQYMYIVASSLTILWAIVILLFLPPDPIRAKGFTERERFIAVARLRSNNNGVRNTHFKAKQVQEVFTDVRFWLAFAIAYLIFVANGPVSTFIPIIIASYGYSPLNSLLLTMPAGAVAGTTSLLATYLALKACKRQLRTWLMALSVLPAIAGALLLWQLPRTSKGALLFSVYLLAAFAAPYGVLMGIQTSNTAGYTKKSVTSSGIFIGYCLGNFTGPLVFKPKDAPSYGPGFLVVLITSIAAAVLAVFYRYVCVWENRRRDKSGILEGFEHAYNDDLTDMMNPQFRYSI